MFIFLEGVSCLIFHMTSSRRVRATLLLSEKGKTLCAIRYSICCKESLKISPFSGRRRVGDEVKWTIQILQVIIVFFKCLVYLKNLEVTAFYAVLSIILCTIFFPIPRR